MIEKYASKKAQPGVSEMKDTEVETPSLDKKREETEALLHRSRGSSEWAPALYERLGKNPPWKRRVLLMVLKSVVMKSLRPLRAQKICMSLEHSDELHQVFLARNMILPLPGGHARFFDHRRDYEAASEIRAHERTKYNFLDMCNRLLDKRSRMAVNNEHTPNGPCPVRDEVLPDVYAKKITLTWPVIIKGIKSANFQYFLPYLDAIREQTFDHGAKKVKDMFKKRRAAATHTRKQDRLAARADKLERCAIYPRGFDGEHQREDEVFSSLMHDIEVHPGPKTPTPNANKGKDARRTRACKYLEKRPADEAVSVAQDVFEDEDQREDEVFSSLMHDIEPHPGPKNPKQQANKGREAQKKKACKSLENRPAKEAAGAAKKHASLDLKANGHSNMPHSQNNKNNNQEPVTKPAEEEEGPKEPLSVVRVIQGDGTEITSDAVQRFPEELRGKDTVYVSGPKHKQVVINNKGFLADALTQDGRVFLMDSKCRKYFPDERGLYDKQNMRESQYWNQSGKVGYLDDEGHFELKPIPGSVYKDMEISGEYLVDGDKTVHIEKILICRGLTARQIYALETIKQLPSVPEKKLWGRSLVVATGAAVFCSVGLLLPHTLPLGIVALKSLFSGGICGASVVLGAETVINRRDTPDALKAEVCEAVRAIHPVLAGCLDNVSAITIQRYFDFDLGFKDLRLVSYGVGHAKAIHVQNPVVDVRPHTIKPVDCVAASVIHDVQVHYTPSPQDFSTRAEILIRGYDNQYTRAMRFLGFQPNPRALDVGGLTGNELDYRRTFSPVVLGWTDARRWSEPASLTPAGGQALSTGYRRARVPPPPEMIWESKAAFELDMTKFLANISPPTTYTEEAVALAVKVTIAKYLNDPGVMCGPPDFAKRCLMAEILIGLWQNQISGTIHLNS